MTSPLTDLVLFTLAFLAVAALALVVAESVRR